MTFEIDFQPIGRRVTCESRETILDAARRAGILLNATCGGEGICGRCLVRVMTGKVSPPTGNEENELGNEQLRAGWRLACQVIPGADLRIHIPPQSLSTAQRIQTEGQALPVALAPAVRSVEVKDYAPSPGDAPRDATLFLRGDSVVAVRPPRSVPLGLAVDLGTTKLAAYLLDLVTGQTLAAAGAMNPQIAYGEDVMARLSHGIQVPGGADQLRRVVEEAMNDLAHSLCAQAGRSTADIADAVVVGNTAMHHLFLRLPVSQLGVAPYAPAETRALDVSARQHGLELAPGATIHLLPNIAGFVGADHVAMLLGSGMLERQGILLGMDIGTNTEISLVARGRHYACSTASGPAFEGAHIRHGMRAAPGAIEKVLIRDGQLFLQTIENQPPVGLCGSGILDLVAQMFKAGLLNNRGALVDAIGDPHMRRGERGLEYVLVPAAGNGGAEITFDRRDVNEIQLAKGAMRAGVNILLQKAGISEQEIDAVIIAGAFGTYLDVQSGIDIGMFPRLPKDRFVQVGNAAGAGARMALLSTAVREKAVQVAERVTYVELANEPSFSSTFARCLLLE